MEQFLSWRDQLLVPEYLLIKSLIFLTSSKCTSSFYLDRVNSVCVFLCLSNEQNKVIQLLCGQVPLFLPWDQSDLFFLLHYHMVYNQLLTLFSLYLTLFLCLLSSPWFSLCLAPPLWTKQIMTDSHLLPSLALFQSFTLFKGRFSCHCGQVPVNCLWKLLSIVEFQ